MTYFVSPSTKGFYSADLHPTMPDDAIEISDDEYRALLSGLSLGKALALDENGRPRLVDPPPPEVDLVAYASSRRWAVEVGGVMVGGAAIATDDSSKVKLTGARIMAQANPAFTTPWRTANGQSVQLDAAGVIQVSDAVLAHVQRTFVTLDQVLARIAAGTITTTAEIDTAFAEGVA